MSEGRFEKSSTEKPISRVKEIHGYLNAVVNPNFKAVLEGEEFNHYKEIGEQIKAMSLGYLE